MWGFATFCLGCNSIFLLGSFCVQFFPSPQMHFLSVLLPPCLLSSNKIKIHPNHIQFFTSTQPCPFQLPQGDSCFLDLGMVHWGSCLILATRGGCPMLLVCLSNASGHWFVSVCFSQNCELLSNGRCVAMFLSPVSNTMHSTEGEV